MNCILESPARSWIRHGNGHGHVTLTPVTMTVVTGKLKLPSQKLKARRRSLSVTKYKIESHTKHARDGHRGHGHRHGVVIVTLTVIVTVIVIACAPPLTVYAGPQAAATGKPPSLGSWFRRPPRRPGEPVPAADETQVRAKRDRPPPAAPGPGRVPVTGSANVRVAAAGLGDSSQRPRLATGRAAVTNGYWHRLFCWYGYTCLCWLFHGHRGRALHLKLCQCLLFARATSERTKDIHVQSRARRRLRYAWASTRRFNNLSGRFTKLCP